MNTEQLRELFDKASNQSSINAFDKIPNKKSMRPDLHAFLLLDEIIPPELHHLGYGHDMIGHSEHDEAWLNVDVEKLASAITPEQVYELVACGIRFDYANDSLHMFT